jgi:cytochrome c-type biogenesis protein CcmH
MRRVLIFLIILLVAVPVFAQGDTTRPVTDDEVNAIAEKLYCPVCENITLDTCGTAACADWRYEIRLQLEQGMSEQQIIDDFVIRFGDRVVGTPQDPTLRALSLITPWVIIALGLGGLAFTLARRGARRAQAEAPAEPTSRYHDLLEQDLAS